MLRFYLQETWPSPVKLLVMEVHIRNSELLLHPIVHSAYLDVNIPPTRSARQHASEQKRADPAHTRRPPTCSVEGGCAARTLGSIGARYIAQCRRYPAFPPISPHYGCGGIDAAPQAHVRSAKKVYPQTREVMGYPAIPGAPFDSSRRRR
jgi:hypothetical protein